jgi:hypothetical protein
MPIEDVDYMKQNSVKQNYIFMIDSTDRDHYQFPTPSVYTITFDQPFTNVFGFEVIDANIPNSAYNIEGTYNGNNNDYIYPINNTFSFYIHDSNLNISTIDPIKYTNISMTPGNYTIQTLIATINSPTNPLLQMHVNGDSNMPIATIYIQPQTNPPEVTNTLVFTCPYPFVIDTSQSTIAETLGFDLLTIANLNESSRPPLLQRFTTFTPNIIHLDNYKYQEYSMYHSVDLPPNIGLGNADITYTGPTAIIRSISLGTSNYVAQSFVVPYNCYLTGVSVALGNSTGVINGPAYWSLYSNNSNFNTDILSDRCPSLPGVPGTLIQLTNLEPDNIGLLDVDYIDGGYTPTTSTSDAITPTFAYLTPGIYWIVLNSPDINQNTLYYNDVPLSSSEALDRYMLVSNDSGVNYIPNPFDNRSDGLQYISSLQITIQQEYHKLTAPGIYSLLGQRSVVLRCKEIEDFSLRSLAYTKHCLGIAKFTLGVVGVSANRLDYSSVPLREFFPIGKLSKLSFRFETINGKLFDFKGVNHTITFAIHYYEAARQTYFKTGLLNPNYTGNFIQDVEYGCGGDAAEEDSDDQEFEYNRDEFEDKYNAREHRHLPDTINNIDREAYTRFTLNDDELESFNNLDINDQGNYDPNKDTSYQNIY